MNKVIFTATLLAAVFSAKAQTSYIGKTSIEHLQQFYYKKYPQSETLIINDTTYTIDWDKQEMIIDGDVIPIKEWQKDAKEASISYGIYLTVTLKLRYNDAGNCISYNFECK